MKKQLKAVIVAALCAVVTLCTMTSKVEAQQATVLDGTTMVARYNTFAEAVAATQGHQNCLYYACHHNEGQSSCLSRRGMRYRQANQWFTALSNHDPVWCGGCYVTWVEVGSQENPTPVIAARSSCEAPVSGGGCDISGRDVWSGLISLGQIAAPFFNGSGSNYSSGFCPTGSFLPVAAIGGTTTYNDNRIYNQLPPQQLQPINLSPTFNVSSTSGGNTLYGGNSTSTSSANGYGGNATGGSALAFNNVAPQPQVVTATPPPVVYSTPPPQATPPCVVTPFKSGTTVFGSPDVNGEPTSVQVASKAPLTKTASSTPTTPSFIIKKDGTINGKPAIVQGGGVDSNVRAAQPASPLVTAAPGKAVKAMPGEPDLLRGREKPVLLVKNSEKASTVPKRAEGMREKRYGRAEQVPAAAATPRAPEVRKHAEVAPQRFVQDRPVQHEVAQQQYRAPVQRAPMPQVRFAQPQQMVRQQAPQPPAPDGHAIPWRQR